MRLVDAGATNGDAVRASRRTPVDEARRDAGESRARPAALVMANDMATAQAWRDYELARGREGWRAVQPRERTMAEPYLCKDDVEIKKGLLG